MSAEPNQEGYINNTTGRVAVTVKRFAESDLNGDKGAYLFNETADAYGLDPWRLIEGVDVCINGVNFDLWGAANWTKRVGPNFLIYVSAKDYASLAGAPA